MRFPTSQAEIPRPLYHFTCEHAAIRILNDDVLRPMPGPSLGIWMTDLAAPTRRGLGLTSHTLRCDRMDFRFTVPEPLNVVPWLAVEPFMPPILHQLAETPGALPAHWFLAIDPQRVTTWKRSVGRAAFERIGARP